MFLKDQDGNIVTVGGAPVLEKVLDKKPRDCELCGYDQWVLGDSCYIMQNTKEGGMMWFCADCALRRGLPKEHYKRNYYSKATDQESENLAARSTLNPLKILTGSDLGACFCYF